MKESAAPAAEPSTKTERSIRNNFLWMLGANAVYSCCQWGMLIALTKIGDSTVVGQYTLGLAIATPILTLTNMQLRSVQSTDATHQYSLQEYMGVRQLMTIIGLLAIWLIALSAHYRVDTTAVILAVSLAKAIESITDVLYGVFQQREQLHLVAKSMMLRGVFSLIVLTLVLHLHGEIVVAVLSMAAAWLVQLLVFDSYQAYKLTRQTSRFGLSTILPKWSWQSQRNLFRIAWPLGIVSMLISLNMNMPRYFVQHYMGEQQLGIFAALAYLSLTIITMADSLGHSAAPRLARMYAGGSRCGYRRLILQLGAAGAAMALLSSVTAMVAGEAILRIAYRPEYAEHSGPFTELMIATGISCIASLLTYAITAARRFRVQIAIFGSAALAAAISALILVPPYEMWGAAHAVVIGSCVHLIAVIWALSREFRPMDVREVVAQAAAVPGSNGAYGA